MKHVAKLPTLLVVFFLLWSCSSGGAPATTSKAKIQAADYTNAEGTITGLEKKRAKAIVNRDMSTLNEIIADDFTGTSWAGDTHSKTKAVNAIEFRVYVAQSLDLEGIRVKIFGDTAVVTLRQSK